MNAINSSARAAILGLSLVVDVAYGSDAKIAPQARSQSAVTKTSSTGLVPESVPSSVTNDRPKSVFSTAGVDAKDPFFPGSLRFQQKIAVAFGAAPATNSTPVDVAALLSEGFQGIFRTEADRLALVNNTILTPGKNSEVSIGTGANERKVKVHCLEITRDSIVITVPDRAEPLVLTLKIKR